MVKIFIFRHGKDKAMRCNRLYLMSHRVLYLYFNRYLTTVFRPSFIYTPFTGLTTLRPVRS